MNKNKSNIDLGVGGATEEKKTKSRGAVKDKNVVSSRNTLDRKGRMLVPEWDEKELEQYVKK